MSLSACVGLKETLAANRPGGSGNTDHLINNPFFGKNFFDGENYRAALERLDGGYDVSMDFIEWMQDYMENERTQARSLISYAEKWNNRLKQRSSLVSYHTTKRAQHDVVRITKEIARLKQSICDDIQKVIDKYRAYVNEVYVSERFRPGRKHRRSNELKKLFKTAHGSCREVSDELELAKTHEKKAREALHTADSACEILESDPTATDKQRARVSETQNKKQTLLTEMLSRLSDAKERHRQAQKTYRLKATEIFKQCQHLEEERLDQIRETLLDFIQAIRASNQSVELNEILEGLTRKVTTQQNSFDDLLFWAKTYGIQNKLTKSLTFERNDDDDEDEDETTKKSSNHTTSKNQAVLENEDDEELSSATTTSRTKVRRTKSTTTTDRKNANLTVPSTTNQTLLNHV